MRSANILGPVPVVLFSVVILSSSFASAQPVTEIIDMTGDGLGHTLDFPRGVAVDGEATCSLPGMVVITLSGLLPAELSQRSSMSARAMGHLGTLSEVPRRVAVDGSGNVFVAGYVSDNVFKITPSGTITEIIDAMGDGAGNTLDFPRGVAVDGAGNAFVIGESTDNVFKITPDGAITQIIDATPPPLPRIKGCVRCPMSPASEPRRDSS